MCLNWNFILPDNQWVKFPMSYTWGEDDKSCSAHCRLYRTLGRVKSLPPCLRDAISLYSLHSGKNYPDMLRQVIRSLVFPSEENLE
jgi:hypothetical protein